MSMETRIYGDDLPGGVTGGWIKITDDMDIDVNASGEVTICKEETSDGWGGDCYHFTADEWDEITSFVAMVQKRLGT